MKRAVPSNIFKNFYMKSAVIEYSRMFSWLKKVGQHLGYLKGLFTIPLGVDCPFCDTIYSIHMYICILIILLLRITY